MPCYGIPMPLVADRIVELLQREGAEFVVGFPENRLLNSASRAGACARSSRARERVAVNIADGFARATNGERLAALRDAVRPGRRGRVRCRRAGLRRPQPDPAASRRARERRAQLDRRRAQRGDSTARSRASPRRCATPRHGPGLFRQALNALYGVRNGPVLRRGRERRAERRRRRRRLGLAAAAAGISAQAVAGGRRGDACARCARRRTRDRRRPGRALRGRVRGARCGSPSARR